MNDYISGIRTGDLPLTKPCSRPLDQHPPRAGREWHELRKPLDKLITKKMVESNINVFHKKALKMCHMINKHAETGIEFVLRGYIVNYTIEVLCVTSFGCDINLNETDGIKLKEALESKEIKLCSLCNLENREESVFHFIAVCPILREFRSIYFKKDCLNELEFMDYLNGKCWKSLVNYCKAAWAYRYELLLQARLRNRTLLEGFDTSAVTLHYILFLLAMFPEHQEAVYQEQIDIFGDSPEVEPTWEQLSKMEYLTRVLKEVMRIYCPIGIFRKPTNDIDLGDYKLPKGSTLFIMFYSLHRDPRLWSHPNEFHPDHFLPEECARRPKGSYLPFSWGPRSCPGSVYAMASLKIAVSTAIRRYKFETGVKFEELEYKYGFLLEPKQEYLVRITNRAPLP
uniref:Uncharacterized protein n=1 Tax=Rhodnius prolixus TaxID=13249 RepID=T1H8D7_RHOPR